MKRRVIRGFFFGWLVVLACVLGGCSQKDRAGTADDEVLTLTEVPEDKTLIVMRMSDGMNYEAMEHAIEAQFPQVELVIKRNTAVNQSVTHHDVDDIVLSTGADYAEEDLAACFIDLSAESYIQNYYLSSLQQSEVNGKLYYLPGPSNIYGIVYNKDMFRR